MKKRVFVHEHADNVAVALTELKVGDTVEVKIGGKPYRLEILENIPYGHKVALQNIEKNAKVIKYGEVIGVATADIPAGSHVHTHNIKSLRY